VERSDVVRRFALHREDPGLDVTVDKRELPADRYRLSLLLGGPGLVEGFRDLGIETVVG
jgi:hypothetical protein